MSTSDALGDLAKIAGAAQASSDFEMARRKAVNNLALQAELRPLHRRATDLLGAVLALSARTRRVVQPKVAIDLDVFAPNGRRAVNLTLGPRS